VTEFPRVARLDAGVVVRELATATGIHLALDGMCPGGQVGAAYVRWPDGHRSVLTCMPPGHADAARRTESLLAAGRAHGVPAPRYELVAELPSAVAIVQELLPGAPPAVTGRRTVESMIEANRRCRGILAGRHDLPNPSLYLRADGPGYCQHGPLAHYDRRTARLLAEVEEIGAAVPEQLAGDDLVHFDFHPENVLVDAAGAVTGVVDWDGAGRSNGYLDLFTLRFDLAHRAPDLGRWLGERLRAAASEEVILACWAHMSLRLVDWSIRHYAASYVTTWLEVAEALRP
jgi:aminoglycoside phosphotransferase (APT) family kinase protein